MVRKTHIPSRQKGSIMAIILFIGIAVVAASFFMPRVSSNVKADQAATTSASIDALNDIKDKETNNPAIASSTETISHVTVPKAVKGLYMSSWVAGSPNLRAKIVADIEKTEANAVIIDIKDYTGMISFKPESTHLQETGCVENRIGDIKSFISSLHDKNIYVIGRVAVFQDPCMVKKLPEDAVKTKDGSKVWKDRNGISWMDAGSEKVWAYNVEIAKTAHAMGFDEINFDYIRYPSDGNMSDISFPVSGTRDKSTSLEGFFKYIDKELRGGRTVGAIRSASSTTYSKASDPAFDELVSMYGLQISTTTASKADTSLDGKKVVTTLDNMPRPVLSADLFGMVTNNNDDLGIGQILEKTSPYVDFIGPMVYPSHYPNNFIGYKNPAAYPYEIVHHAMVGGVTKLKNIGINPLKLRPWLQDFNLGATYTAAMVRRQIEATYDSGLTGWMLWDASNTYTPGGSLGL